MTNRQWLETIAPPALLDLAFRALRRPRFFGTYSDFGIAQASAERPDSKEFAAAAADRPIAALSDWVDSSALQLLAAFAPIVASRAALSVLDVGGASGDAFYVLRHHLSHVSFEWTVLETPAMVDAHSNRPDIRFTSEKKDVDRLFDVVHMSGVLQYLPNPYEALHNYCRRCRFVTINRVPLIGRDRITMQYVSSPHSASWPAWFFGEERFLAELNHIGRIRMRWAAAQDSPFLDGRRVPFHGMLIERR